MEPAAFERGSGDVNECKCRQSVFVTAISQFDPECGALRGADPARLTYDGPGRCAGEIAEIHRADTGFTSESCSSRRKRRGFDNQGNKGALETALRILQMRRHREFDVPRFGFDDPDSGRLVEGLLKRVAFERRG